MSKSILAPVAVALIAFSSVTATASAYAQQQPAVPAVQQRSHAADQAGTTQLAARSNDDSGVRAAAPKLVVPLRQTPALTPTAPATPDADCVGPVSFCNVYFGS
ncbi:hypothetical protein [Burkholderia cepacia]|uniref:Uncharacterized protein n=1 Tax=Burkholderia cepacia GG4 TaxID=1009846 RepID=A0A9W3PCQ4_BURCE|nr:hypothetical protein [Burkholderia cepacia]AFQ51820.1 hypothetical protein GEM_5436 [Burkholderia cepacia GG4]